MKKLFVFIGDGGSGKTTLINELIRKYPNRFKKIVTCTSRKPRIGEIDGKDYHFINKECFDNNSDLVLVKNPVQGDCYGTKKSELYSETHNLLLSSKPTGVLRLIDLGFQNLVVVRINISEILKIQRMQQRGDTEEIIKARLKSDSSITMELDFKSLLIIDLNASQPLDKKVEYILKAC